MIGRALRALMVAGVVVTLALAWFLGPVALLVVAACHPLAIAAGFAMSRVFGDRPPPDARLGARRALACYGAEVVASMRGVWFATPFLEHVPAPRPAGAARDVALLFVHGYFCNRAVWHAFMRDAAARGYRCEAVTLEDTFASIASHVEVVRRAADALRTPQHPRVAIVAHSMGGLVARHAFRHADADGIAGVVTLGTPHRGTHAARYGRHASVREMRRDSAWLATLAAHEGQPDGGALPRERYTAIFSWHDNVVYPQSTAALEGAHCVALAGVGHVALLYDRRARQAVFDALERAAAVQPVTTPAGAS